jgi:hypothetical protein
MTKIHAFILISLLVSGCSSWEESFECPVGTGMRCSALSTVNAHMDKGLLPIETDDAPDRPYFGADMLKTLGNY